jgi:drug/metabolite transporter (DMT)-like permease
MAVLLVALSGVFGACFGLGYRFKNKEDLPTFPMLLFFSISVTVLTFFLVYGFGYPVLSEAAALAGTVHGISLGTAMVLFLGVTKKARLNITWTILQFNIIVPFLASIIYYKEHPSILPWIGILLFFLSIILFGLGKKRDMEKIERDSENTNKNNANGVDIAVGIMLFLSAFLSGVANLSAKVYSTTLAPEESFSPFSLSLYSGFSMMIIIGSIIAIKSIRDGRKKTDSEVPEEDKKSGGIRKKTIFVGIYMGIFMVANFACLITGLTEVPGSIAYPLRGLMNNIFIFILAFLLFKEKANRIELAGVAVALVSIALISYGNAG